MTMPGLLVPAAVLATALVACVTDLRSRRIPNWLTLASALVALAVHVAAAGPTGAASTLGGWLLGTAIFLLPFALGGMGGGDVKLLAALGAWLGPWDVLRLAAATGVAGALCALALALASGYLRQALANLQLMLIHFRVSGVRPLEGMTLADARGPRLAYAVPIFIGAMVTIWLR